MLNASNAVISGVLFTLEYAKNRFTALPELISLFLLIKNLKPTTNVIKKINKKKPPLERINSLIDIITAVGVGKSSPIPIPSYIFANTGTTLISMKTLTVIGTENIKSEKIMKELYRPLYLRETPLVSTSIQTSEIIK